jgi:nucleoside-diphosphate-sugar epimerase
MQRIKPDILVHTAWLTTPKTFWESPENERWLQASKRIIQEFIASGGAYSVVTGSCAEYSWDKDDPLSESSLELPSSTYGKAKLDLLNWIREREIPFLWSRIFFQFGGDEPIGKLIPTVIDSLKNGDLFVTQNACDTRDFVHIQDISNILGILITKKINGVVNIGRGEGVKIKNLVQSLASILGREDLIQWKNGINRSTNVVSDPRKLQSLIGTYRWKSFDDSLRELANTRKI